MSSTLNQCVICSITYCKRCDSANVCASCVASNQILANNTCTCPAGTTLNSSNNYCVSCNINGCKTCNSANVCSTCNTNLLITGDNKCSCIGGVIVTYPSLITHIC